MDTREISDPQLIRSFIYNTKRPSVKQSMKCQVCSKLADLPADLPTTQYWHLVVKNGDFILTDQVADLPADLPPSTGI